MVPSQPPKILDLWPLGGPSRGGTMVWLLSEARGRGQQGSDVMLSVKAPSGMSDGWPAVNATRHSPMLTSPMLTAAVMPPLPRRAPLPMQVRVWVGTRGAPPAVMQRLSALPMPNAFTFFSDEGLRSATANATIRDCVLGCERYPPTLFDVAAGLLPPSGAPPSQLSRLAVRAIPPGGVCHDWTMLRPMSLEECKRLGVRTRWLGVRREPNSFAGCVMWHRPPASSTSNRAVIRPLREERPLRASSWVHAAAGASYSYNAASSSPAVGCAVHGRGGHCLCVGPLPSLSPASRSARMVALITDQTASVRRACPPHTRSHERRWDAGNSSHDEP